MEARGRQALRAEMQAEVGGWGRIPGGVCSGCPAVEQMHSTQNPGLTSFPRNTKQLWNRTKALSLRMGEVRTVEGWGMRQRGTVPAQLEWLQWGKVVKTCGGKMRFCCCLS